ncbi:MAG: OFA family MFS transporter [Candidatus Omnitrophica bacterium]|nr:OFA family MFS transporter [Candidatus Omnitrophota bacterium]
MGNSKFMVIVAGIVIMLCLGVAYSWGVFLMPLENDLGWSRTQISLAVSILLLVFSAFMSIGGISERKFGPRITATIGGVFVSLGWIGAAFSKTPQWLYLFYGVLGGIGTGLAYIPSVSCGIKWFPEKKGLITGVIVFGFGFGAAFLSPIITYFIKLLGWRTTMLLGGAIFGLLIICFSQFLKAPVCGFEGTEGEEAQSKENNFSPWKMVKTSLFKTMFVTYFIAMVAGMMTIGHVVAFAHGKGGTAIQGAFALTILSIFNGLGRILAGHFSDRWGGKWTLIVLFGIIGLSMFLFYHASGIIFFYLISALIGVCFGGFLAVYPPLTSKYFGCEHFAINYGLVFIGYGSGCFLGPIVGGLMYDFFNSYKIAFYSSGTLAFFGGIIIWFFLKEPEKMINKN